MVQVLGRAASYLSLFLMLVIFLDVVTRSTRQVVDPDSMIGKMLQNMAEVTSSSKLQELEWHIHGALFLMCLGYAYLCNAHVRVTFFSDFLPNKARVWIELIGVTVSFSLICYVMIRFGWEFAERAYLRGEGSSALTGLPHRWIIKSLLPFSFVLVALAGFSVAVRCIAVLRGHLEFREVFGER